MNAELYLVATILVLAGLAVAAIGIAHRRGRLRRNIFVGLRSPATLTSDRAWKQAHDAASRATGIGGTLLALGGLAALLLRPQTETYATVLLLAPTLAGAAVLVAAGVRGHLLTRTARRRP